MKTKILINKLLLGLLIIFICVLGLYYLYLYSNNESLLEYPTYSHKESEYYRSKTNNSWSLLACFSTFYKKSTGKAPKSSYTFITEGYLKELPREYYSSRRGSNRLSRKFSYRYGGWFEELESTGNLHIEPHIDNLDEDAPEHFLYDDCKVWYEETAKKEFADIIIKRPGEKK